MSQWIVTELYLDNTFEKLFAEAGRKVIHIGFIYISVIKKRQK